MAVASSQWEAGILAVVMTTAMLALLSSCAANSTNDPAGYINPEDHSTSTDIPEDELVDVTEHNLAVGRTCVAVLCQAACRHANHVAARCHNGGCQCRDRRPKTRHPTHIESRAASEDNINVNYNVNNNLMPFPLPWSGGGGGGGVGGGGGGGGNVPPYMYPPMYPGGLVMNPYPGLQQQPLPPQPPQPPGMYPGGMYPPQGYPPYHQQGQPMSGQSGPAPSGYSQPGMYPPPPQPGLGTYPTVVNSSAQTSAQLPQAPYGHYGYYPQSGQGAPVGSSVGLGGPGGSHQPAPSASSLGPSFSLQVVTQPNRAPGHITEEQSADGLDSVPGTGPFPTMERVHVPLAVQAVLGVPTNRKPSMTMSRPTNYGQRGLNVGQGAGQFGQYPAPPWPAPYARW